MGSPLDVYNLNQIDIAALKVVADACEYTLGKHVAEPLIVKRCNKNLVRDIGKSLKKLHSKRLIIRHPTGGSMTYQLSREGLRVAHL